jgi:ABC-type polysaccharide/polyol phosphate export permease
MAGCSPTLSKVGLGAVLATISMGGMIATIGVVFGQIFNSPMTEFLPFLAAGMIFWSFISSVITEGCTSFIAAEGIIKQFPSCTNSSLFLFKEKYEFQTIIFN